MIRQLFTKTGALAAIAAALISTEPALAQHHGGGGGHGGGYHGGGYAGGYHGGYYGGHYGGYLHNYPAYHSYYRPYSNLGFLGGYYYPGLFGYGFGYDYGLGYGYPWAYSAPSYRYSYPSVDYSYPSVDYTPSVSAYFDPQSAGVAGAPTTEAPATVTVILPSPDAQVWFDDHAMQQQGAMRTFVSPPLAPNQDFVYQIRARWQEQGRTMDQTRTATVRAGQTTAIDFTKSEPTQTSETPNRSS
jgi:uncharacterized protein (TIGR03000 family)